MTGRKMENQAWRKIKWGKKGKLHHSLIMHHAGQQTKGCLATNNNIFFRRYSKSGSTRLFEEDCWAVRGPLHPRPVSSFLLGSSRHPQVSFIHDAAGNRVQFYLVPSLIVTYRSLPVFRLVESGIGMNNRIQNPSKICYCTEVSKK